MIIATSRRLSSTPLDDTDRSYPRSADYRSRVYLSNSRLVPPPHGKPEPSATDSRLVPPPCGNLSPTSAAPTTPQAWCGAAPCGHLMPTSLNPFSTFQNQKTESNHLWLSQVVSMTEDAAIRIDFNPLQRWHGFTPEI